MAKQQKNKKDPIKNVDYEQLGRAIESIVTTGYFNRVRYYRMAFVKGIFTGLGSIIGATLVITLILWTLSLLEAIPFIGPIMENLQQTVEPQ